MSQRCAGHNELRNFSDNNKRIDADLPIISFVNFQTLDPVRPLTVSGRLRMPVTGTGDKIPAVVIVHGSVGIDSRGAFMPKRLTRRA
jgi:hypothetical protein